MTLVDVLAEESEGRWGFFRQYIANGVLKVGISESLVEPCVLRFVFKGGHFLEYVVVEDIVIDS